ncbi:hypothetical protein [uncultured Litoreibacter sp.]|uniref:hypothetical protein n=1 Tax=uncultured Litoreibacter sp. TaxID=1392394 RepID=UPI002612DDAD|nr:hypothetical protein [uncultured Litoreibacter sp.]
MPPHHRDEMVLSYSRGRNALGFLGMLLPLLLIFGGIMQLGKVEPSISDFYHTTFRDVFVGTLCAIGVFLVSYRGYPKSRNEWISDDRVATIAGLSAFGVAFFPNEVPGGQEVTSFAQAVFGIFPTAVLHYV